MTSVVQHRNGRNLTGVTADTTPTPTGRTTKVMQLHHSSVADRL